MIRNRILEIVIFLIDYAHRQAGRLPDTGDVWEALEAQGYSDDEITSAYTWFLRRYETRPRRYFSVFPKSASARRVLTPPERAQLSTEAQGLLFKLQQAQVIDQEQFEAVLDRLSLLRSGSVGLDQAKFLISSVIFGEADEVDALTVFDADITQSDFVN
ncbi:MAG TPA: DUF494 family protein [Candidatus Deferrimicrobium sp.]|nr:DUF494 family protein [Candidatus Deferrimicrobium sp.]